MYALFVNMDTFVLLPPRSKQNISSTPDGSLCPFPDNKFPERTANLCILNAVIPTKGRRIGSCGERGKHPLVITMVWSWQSTIYHMTYHISVIMTFNGVVV